MTAAPAPIPLPRPAPPDSGPLVLCWVCQCLTPQHEAETQHYSAEYLQELAEDDGADWLGMRPGDHWMHRDFRECLGHVAMRVRIAGRLAPDRGGGS